MNEILKQENIEIIKNRQLLESIAKLYAKVFAEPPWNEFSRCPCCNRFYGQDVPIGSLSSCCEKQLIEAYPLNETVNYIKAELKKPNAFLAYLSLLDGRIIGFAWGYQTNCQKFANEKYKTSEMIEKVINALYNSGLSSELPIFYFSECGIDSEYRRKGHANELTKTMIDIAQSLGLPLIMRTNIQSPMVAVAQRFGMKQCFGPEVIYQHGQIITTERVINEIDLENPSRILFIYKK